MTRKEAIERLNQMLLAENGGFEDSVKTGLKADEPISPDPDETETFRSYYEKDVEAYNMAIGALRAQDKTASSCGHENDLISRHAALDVINKLPSAQPDYKTDHGYMWLCPECGEVVHSDFARCVRCGHVRDAQPEQQWIPCTERLPEEYGEYRITWTTSAAPKKRFIGDAEYDVTGEWDAERDIFIGKWLLDEYITAYPDVKVIAWKPLEEPYREEGD